MTAVNTSMFKSVIVGVIFLTMWVGFNAMFIGSQVSGLGTLTIDQILSVSWDVLTQPELIIINSALFAVGLVISLFVARELLPV